MKLDAQKVYEYLKTIPKGKVTTYGGIARYFGDRNLARHIGNVLHRNPDGDKYPCYKVVDSDGCLAKSYTFGGIERQKERLEQDGVEVINYRVDLKKYGI